MIPFDSIINEARTRFAEYVIRKNWLGRPKRDLAAALRADGVNKDTARYLAAIEHGYEIGWAAIVVANPELYVPEDNASAAAVIISRDTYFDARPDHLLSIAGRLARLRQVELSDELDAATRNTALWVRDDDGRPRSDRLPHKLTDGRTVWFATAQILRACLPGKVLQSSLLPLAYRPDQIEQNLVLPARCWPKRICQPIDRVLRDVEKFPPIEALPISKQQLNDDEQEALRNPYRAITADDVLAGASKGTVTLTPRCAAFIKKLAKQQRMGRFWWLRVGGHINARELDITSQFDKKNEACIVSEGVKILIRASEAPAYRGIVIDYENTGGRDGFTFTESH